jgi:hypothetical protein
MWLFLTQMFRNGRKNPEHGGDNNSRFGDFVDRIYPIEFQIKDTTDTDWSASYVDLHLEIDSEDRLDISKTRNAHLCPVPRSSWALDSFHTTSG